MTSDDSNNDNVVRLSGLPEAAGSDNAPDIASRIRRLETAEVEMLRKKEAARRMERAFLEAHAKLEQRVADRTQALADANEALQQKAEESARMEAAFEKLMANLEHRIQERAQEILRTDYGIGTTVISGPGHPQALRLVTDHMGEAE